MSQDQKYRKLPVKRPGSFLKFVDETSFGRLVLYGLLAYVSVVVTISLIEFVALKLLGLEWVKYSNGDPVGFWDTIYFNFVTILTVGYGDISPNGFGKVLSTIEAVFGVGLFAGAISLLTVKALRPSPDTIVFSEYAYYCLDEQRFMVIFLNTSVSRLENCSISSYFKIGRDWQVSPAISPPFLTTAVQTFFIDEHSEKEIRENLMDGDCLRVCVSGNLLGSEVAASVQYKPHEILVLQNRKFIASYEPFWKPDFGDAEFVKMFHYKPENAETLSERFPPNTPV
jgi:hypothetical protein